MSRKFISLVVAASIAVAGMTASQAQADKRTRNVILGAAALAILGAAASQSRGDTVTRQTHAQPHHSHKQGGWHWHGNVHHRHDGNNHGIIRDRVRPDRDSNTRTRTRTHVTPRPLPGRVYMAELPRSCLITVQNRRGTYKMFEKKCLERTYNRTATLPQTCKINVSAGGRTIRGYRKQCLKQHSQQAKWRNRH